MNSECEREKVCLVESPWNIQSDHTKKQEPIKSIETYAKKILPNIFNSLTVQQEYKHVASF
jgi:hypothetical protein